MTDDIVVRTMTMEEFNELPGQGNTIPNVSPERQAIRGMKVGEVLVFKHGSLSHKGNTCGIAKIVTTENKEHKNRLRWKSRHLPDGTVAVACVEVTDEH